MELEAIISQAQSQIDAAEDAATLDNVRDRALRAEATWQALADQARAVAEQRRKIAATKAVENASEAG